METATQEFNPFRDLKDFIRGEISQLESRIENGTGTAGKVEAPIKVEEAAEITGYSVSYLRRMSAAPEKYTDAPPFHKKLGRVFYFKSELVAWIKSQEQKSISHAL